MLLARRLSTQRAFVVRDEVRAAVAARRPVVALESTIITHGMPFPRNLEVRAPARRPCGSAGAVPATVAVLAGAVRVGLADAELEAVAASGAPAPRRSCRGATSAGPRSGRALTPRPAARRPSRRRRGPRAGAGAVFATGGLLGRAPRRVRHAGRRVAINR